MKHMRTWMQPVLSQARVPGRTARKEAPKEQHSRHSRKDRLISWAAERRAKKARLPSHTKSWVHVMHPLSPETERMHLC